MLLNYAELHIFGIDVIFSDLKSYQLTIEGFLESKKSTLEKEYNETELEIESKKAGENANQYFLHMLEMYSQRHHEISRLFPHNFRASFLTQTISVIESQLKRICDHYGSTKKQIFIIDDLKGNDDLEKCKDFLKKVAGIDFNDLNPEWQFIKNCKALRNKIVHEESKIKKTNLDIIKFIKSNSSLELEKDMGKHQEYLDFVIVNRELIDKLLKSGENFFVKLLKEHIKYSC